MEEERDGPKTFLYVERKTGFLYEAQLFDNFVLYKPATPEFADVLRKESYEVFNRDFEEFAGDVSAAREFMDGYSDYGFIVYRT